MSVWALACIGDVMKKKNMMVMMMLVVIVGVGLVAVLELVSM